jgi:hypothetical protein
MSFSQFRRWSQRLNKIRHTHDKYSGFAVSLHKKAVVVFDGPIQDLTELGSSGNGGYSSGHSELWL